ncbi:MAG TPA: hypothetical protein VF100_09865 [Thermoanaerobaculia bacterium]
MDQVGSLEIEQDLEHQRRAWRWRRVGWTAIGLVLLAAVAGVFGPPGPLSRTTAGEPGSALWVEHPRFVRQSRTAEIRVHLRTADPAPRLWLDERLLAALDVDHVTPQPESATAASGRLVLELSVDPAAGAAAGVTLVVEAKGPGLVDGRVGLVGGPAVRLGLLVYP